MSRICVFGLCGFFCGKFRDQARGVFLDQSSVVYEHLTVPVGVGNLEVIAGEGYKTRSVLLNQGSVVYHDSAVAVDVTQKAITSAGSPFATVLASKENVILSFTFV